MDSCDWRYALRFCRRRLALCLAQSRTPAEQTTQDGVRRTGHCFDQLPRANTRAADDHRSCAGCSMLAHVFIRP